MEAELYDLITRDLCDTATALRDKAEAVRYGWKKGDYAKLSERAEAYERCVRVRLEERYGLVTDEKDRLD